jgi:flap endonuclease-1
LKWTQPDEEGLVKFMCGDKNFNEERIRSGAKKLCKAKTGQTQGRLDSFFKVLPSSKPSTPSTPASKRKVGCIIYLFVGFFTA